MTRTSGLMRHVEEMNSLKEKNQDEWQQKTPQLTLEDMEQKKFFFNLVKTLRLEYMFFIK